MKNKNKKAQIIVLMGIMLTIAVVSVAVIAADLANIGVGTLRVHSKALIPEFTNIRDRFGEILNNNINQYQDIEYGFNKTYIDFYFIEIQYGNFFNATLNQYGSSGDTIIMLQDSNELYYGNILFVNATLSLYDGTTSITETVLYHILYLERS